MEADQKNPAGDFSRTFLFRISSFIDKKLDIIQVTTKQKKTKKHNEQYNKKNEGWRMIAHLFSN